MAEKKEKNMWSIAVSVNGSGNFSCGPFTSKVKAIESIDLWSSGKTAKFTVEGLKTVKPFDGEREILYGTHQSGKRIMLYIHPVLVNNGAELSFKL